MQATLPLALLAVSVLSACRSAKEQPDIALQHIFAGQVSTMPEPKNIVARSSEQWRAFYRPTVLGAELEPPDFDWSKQMLIAVALGSRPSGGYAVTIERITQQDSHWVVHARESRPPEGSMQTAMITSPFDCVATPRFDGRVVFVVE